MSTYYRAGYQLFLKKGLLRLIVKEKKKMNSSSLNRNMSFSEPSQPLPILLEKQKKGKSGGMIFAVYGFFLSKSAPTTAMAMMMAIATITR